MNAFRIVISSVVVSFASAGMAQVAPRPTVAEPVPRAIFITTMDEEFKRMDANKNGVLTRKEIEDFQRAAATLAAQRRNQQLFAELDKDRNGVLTAAEFASLPMNMPPVNAAPVLAQTDGNRDGQVTLVEYRTGKLTNFDRMDADKDGVVSQSEMRAVGLIK